MSTRTPRPARRRARAAAQACLAGLCGLLAGGADYRQSALDSAGPQAGRIETLWWVFFWVCAVVYVLVLAFLLLPLVRNRRLHGPGAATSRGGAGIAADPAITSPEPAGERRMTLVVGAMIAVTILVLFGLLFGDMVTGRAIHALSTDEALTIRVTARQWWWEVEYQEWPAEFGERVQSNRVTTANEIHIPTGRPVRLELQSPDVIHSFWVPNLDGKKDIVPGHPVYTWLQADRPETFRGQCAEFCGYQHANMRFAVVAESPDDFRRWLDAGRQPAREPTTDEQRRGRDVFLGRGQTPDGRPRENRCVLCHTVQGTEARGRVGPDLTHLASRPYLGAGAVPNTVGHLAGWVVDPQKIKPGNRMPPNPLPPQDLRALLEYLTSLK